MDLFSVELENFGPFKVAKVPLYKQGLVAITAKNLDSNAADNNGSGKSTLLKAITWGLFGESIDGERGDAVINRDARSAFVRIDLGDDPARPWKLERHRTKTSIKLKLWTPEGEPVEESRQALQAKVEQMVGCDFTAFRNTVMYGQNDMSRFARPTTRDSARKEMLQNIQRTRVYADCKEVASARAARHQAVVDSKDRVIEAAAARMEEHDLGALKGRRKREAERVSRRVREHIEDSKALAAKSKVDHSEAISAIKLEIGKVEAAEEKFATLEADADAAREKVLPLEEIWQSRTQDLVRATMKLDGAKERIDALGDDRCPLCTSPLDSGSAREHKERLESELTSAASELTKADRAERKARKALDGAKEMLAETSRAAKKARPWSSGKVSALSRQLRDLESEVSEAQMYKERAAASLIEAKKLRDQPNPIDPMIKEAKAKRKALRVEIAKAEFEREEAANKLALARWWVKGFGNQGLPSFALDSAMPFITAHANEYLEVLTDGDITVEFSTQRELKSSKGEFRDEISMTWNAEGAEGYPLSGGQLKKVELATDLALMDLMASGEGGAPDILILDEAMDGLDLEGRHRVVDLLKKLREVRGTIFVVTHDAELVEAFERTVTITKQDGVACVS